LIESARFFRKDVFDRVGGYDEQLEAGEDWDLHARVETAGYKFGNIKSEIRHRENGFTIRRAITRRYYYGRTLMKYIRKHPHRSMAQFAPLRANYLKNWKIFVSAPRYALGLFALRAIEYLVTLIAIVPTIFDEVRPSLNPETK
jgi:GT2 family glycosyltransferase